VLRTSIDAVLIGARRQWEDGRPLPADAVVLIAKMDDACVRIVARRSVVLDRARDLAWSGWDVAVSDSSGRPLAGDGRAVAPQTAAEATPTVELPEDAEPPPLARLDVHVLSQTA
jgi:hypothetical protein